MISTKHELCARLDSLFRDVRLGDGISIHEADVVDDNGSDIERRKARKNDETFDWQKLIGSELFSAQSFCFMDAQGRLFHIPACLASLMLVDAPEKDPETYEAALFVLPVFGPAEFELFGERRIILICDILQYLRSKTDERYFEKIDSALSDAPSRLRVLLRR